MENTEQDEAVESQNSSTPDLETDSDSQNSSPKREVAGKSHIHQYYSQLLELEADSKLRASSSVHSSALSILEPEDAIGNSPDLASVPPVHEALSRLTVLNVEKAELLQRLRILMNCQQWKAARPVELSSGEDARYGLENEASLNEEFRHDPYNKVALNEALFSGFKSNFRTAKLLQRFNAKPMSKCQAALKQLFTPD